MKQAELKVVPRNPKEKRAIKVLRRQGMVPANIYGPGLKNELCAFSEKDLRKTFNNDFQNNFILNLVSEEKTLSGKKVVVKALERDPKSWTLTHADLYEVRLDRPLSTNVSLHFTGVPDGVKNEGGIMQVIRRNIRIRALPADIPEYIEIDTSALGLGSSLHIGEIKFSDKITVLDSKDFAVVSVIEPEKEEVVTPVAAAPGADAAGAGAAAAAGTGAATAAGTGAAAGAGAAAAAGTGKAGAEKPKK